MAIYHLNVRGISPSRGSSAIAAAAYQSGEAIVDERDGLVRDYSRRERIAATGIELPEGAPAWGRARLWHEAEAAHQGGTALVAQRWEVALPRELDEREREAAVIELCGLWPDRARDWAIHDSGDGNPHAHILVSALPLGEGGFERPKATKSTKAYLCRDAGGNDVMVPAAQWRQAKADGLAKVYNYLDGKRHTVAEAEALGMGKDQRRSKTPVAVSRLADGTPAYDAAKSELRARRRDWADICNRWLGVAAARTNTEAAEVDERSNAARLAEAMDRAREAVSRHDGEDPARALALATEGVGPEDRAAAMVPAELRHEPTVHEGPGRIPDMVARNEEIRRGNGAIDRAWEALRSCVASVMARLSGWWRRAEGQGPDRARRRSWALRGRALAMAELQRRRRHLGEGSSGPLGDAPAVTRRPDPAAVAEAAREAAARSSAWRPMPPEVPRHRDHGAR